MYDKHIINVKSNGAIKEFLKLLSRNRQELTIVFIDSDTRLQEGSRNAAKLAEQVLREAGFNQSFIDERLRYIGQMEFEDAFPDNVLAGCLETHWPKVEGCWEAREIEELRGERKFSVAISGRVWNYCDETADRWSKPIFGKKIAEYCPADQIPMPILQLFELARRTAGVDTSPATPTDAELK